LALLDAGVTEDQEQSGQECMDMHPPEESKGQLLDKWILYYTQV